MKSSIDMTRAECEAWGMPYYDLTDEERAYFKKEVKGGCTFAEHCRYWHVDLEAAQYALDWLNADPRYRKTRYGHIRWTVKTRALGFSMSPELKGEVTLLDIAYMDDGSIMGYYVSLENPGMDGEKLRPLYGMEEGHQQMSQVLTCWDIRDAKKPPRKGEKAEGQENPRDRGSRSAMTMARMAAGMTQGELAEAIGCKQKDVSRWETGKVTPSVMTLTKIAKALGCEMEALAGDWE